MSTRTDYAQLAAKVDYAALEIGATRAAEKTEDRRRSAGTVARKVAGLARQWLEQRPTGRRVEDCRSAGESGVFARMPKPLDRQRQQSRKATRPPLEQTRHREQQADRDSEPAGAGQEWTC